jgi:hypothetical protein
LTATPAIMDNAFRIALQAAQNGFEQGRSLAGCSKSLDHDAAQIGL